ncbi:hypothetical protein [Paenibacillus apiarius]|uniref:Uncharacterized protein n=1 Tax=Paenibacillus apiarius TaxID=46240 RepID=A0ABT4DM14_9BACL|nr:hypothetical protein [Paenibacillus apiarius]MBN3526219.1 hypothetical protein [Paenibacillus apiarius]MCY9516147.1 hypothetical protein [Paenibacillus apiarius]MCY9518394.1 hypothetical protein [Paenibacillus apiarius]MCY9551205.1 hypothetical protein [Paenibacillus apiarius]MCY9558359.1 hypothetical protein [Paenibacillus apiarius]
MNVKPVEMQIAIPRTQDASAIHQQLQQRPLTEQSLLNEQAEKMIKKSSQRNEEVQSAQESRIRDQEKEDRPDSEREHSEERHEAAQNSEALIISKPAEHPYKGKHIDFMC